MWITTLRELLIVFVYDCEKCQREEDDPQDAVVYFYPSWVSEQQRLALCGQLMGVNQFLNTVFSSPNILALQTGKFAMKPLGRFILCVGTDRNIPDLVLDTRINTLYHLLRFYHKDFETISDKANIQFPEKLNQIFETYLPILQYAGNIFGSIPTFNLPKSASSVFLEAIQILQCFQNRVGVMGGVLLHQNKVVATQLSAKLTKLLVITDPYRIKLPADSVPTQFRLPVGVQLMTVHVVQSEVETLRKEASQLSSALKSTTSWRQDSLNQDKLSMKGLSGTKDNISGGGGGMKRDISRHGFLEVVEETEGEGDGERVPDVVRDAVKARQAARLLSVAPAGFVVPDPTTEKRAQTTDFIPTSTKDKVIIRYHSLGISDEDPEWKQSESTRLRPYYNTISDPSFPLFRRDGLPASRSLYDTRVARHYTQLSQETQKEKNMVPMTELGSRKPNTSFPLTPLMAKLSLLAMEQRCGEVGTPAAERPPPTPTPVLPPRALKPRPRRARERKDSEPLEENVLYVCGYQDMTLLLLMDSKTSQDPDQIHSLWQMSVSSLSELETHLHHCLEHFPGGAAGAGSDSYSWLSVDPTWGTVQRGGAWAGARLELLTALHHAFNCKPSLTETIVRCEDSIVYGYQCGGAQVFYQQACSEGGVAGLPAPSDLMGVVSLKAKRRLERDHGIVLL